MFSQLAVKDLLFLYYKFPQEEKKINLYTHFNKIIFVVEGKKMIRHREKSWLLTNESAVFIKTTAYSVERFWEIDWEVLCFYCPDHYLRQIFKEYWTQFPVMENGTPSGDLVIDINVNAVTRAFFYSIMPYFQQSPPPAEELLELKFKELIFCILSNPANTALLSYINKINDQQKPLLQDVMEANYSFNLSLTEFSRIAHRSLASFKREFNEIFHTSPGKWLLQKRLEYAKHLVNNSRKNVNEICDESGFESVTHFIRVFKERFGLSPLHYRKKINTDPLTTQ
jgi:AraC-like DNA-binding protein